MNPITFPATHATDLWKPVVLAALSALAPTGGEVRFANVVSWVATQPGFPGWDAWGTMNKRGTPYPKGQRAITLAAGRLKEEGKIRAPRRGYYALVGTVEARPQAPEVTPAPDAPKADAPKARPVSLNIVVEAGIQFTPQTGAVNSAAYEAADTGLRRMAAEQTRCFGGWSSRSEQCRECPLAGLCQQAGMVDFAEVAAALDAATVAEIAEGEALANPTATTPEPVAADSLDIPGGADFHNSNGGVAVPFTVPCHTCGQDIEAGTLAMYRDADKGGGIFHAPSEAHPDCNPA